MLEENGLKVTALTADHTPVAPVYGYRFKGHNLGLPSGDFQLISAVREHQVTPCDERRLQFAGDNAKEPQGTGDTICCWSAVSGFFSPGVVRSSKLNLT